MLTASPCRCRRALLVTAVLLLARDGGAQAPLAPKECKAYNLTIDQRPLGMSLGAADAAFVVTRLKKERPGVAVGDELLSINGVLTQTMSTLKQISAQLKAAHLPIVLSLRKPTCAGNDDGAAYAAAIPESSPNVDIEADSKAARSTSAIHAAATAIYAACPQQGLKKLVVYTALFGSYVKTLKEPIHGCGEQVHYVAYTDRPDIFQRATAYDPPSCWHVVLDPDYHLKRDPTNWLHNSIDQHKSNFNLAKFYKTNPHRLPELQGFEYAVWADATVRVEAAWPEYFAYLDSKLRPRPNDRLNDQHGPAHPAMLFSHPTGASNKRDGRLENEVIASRNLGEYANGTIQDVQEIQKQYEHYIQSGFKERWFDTRRGFMQRWHDTRSGLPSQRAENSERDASQDGVWLTTLIVWAMQNPETTLFLDSWWFQNAYHTTQDQVSFPFVVWKTGLWPYTLPDSVVKRRPDLDQCDWFTKLPHGQ